MLGSGKAAKFCQADLRNEWRVVFVSLAIAALLWLCHEGSVAAEEDVPPGASPVQFVDMMDLHGQIHTLSHCEDGEIRVFVFLSTICPVSNSYIPELNRLSEQFSQSPRVRFYGVVSDPAVNREDAVRHFAEYAVQFEVLVDGSGLLAENLRPTHVPEAFVVNDRRQIVYRGSIDNAYESLGRRRVSVEHFYVRDAVQALLHSKPVEIAETKPVGCLFRTASPLAADSERSDVTWCRDIAPIIQTRCLNCHRAGQVAPFTFESYDDVVPHAKMIVEVTQRRLMPPWIPGPGSEHRFVGERWLTNHELQLLKAWADSGTVYGEKADLPPNPEFADGWQLGEPDLIVEMSDEFHVPADGPDLLQNFVIPIQIAENKLVAAVEFHPGNRRVVHHAVLFLDDKGQARKLDAATPEPGYGNFGGPGFLPSGALGGWSVGNTPRRLPNGMGRYLRKGSDLVVQVHYHPTGKPEVDRSEIGLYFVDRPLAESLASPATLVGSIWMANYEMDIPAGDSRYSRATTYRLPRDVIMTGIVPHMHLLGKSMTVTARLPDGTEKQLVDIPNWNYNWQDEYYYERPFPLPAGTVLRVEAVFDNSAENPSNPSSPPQRVTWGEETTDEMLFCFFLLTADRTEDLIHTIFDNLAHDLKQPRAQVKP